MQVRGWNILTGIYFCKYFTITYEYYTFVQYGGYRKWRETIVCVKLQSDVQV